MSSGNSLTPGGDLSARRVADPSSIDLASVEYIVSKASIADAWKKVRSNQGAPGVDHISIEQFPKWGRPKWKAIQKQLLDGAYEPTPVLRVEIPKESGERSDSSPYARYGARFTIRLRPDRHLI